MARWARIPSSMPWRSLLFTDLLNPFVVYGSPSLIFARPSAPAPLRYSTQFAHSFCPPHHITGEVELLHHQWQLLSVIYYFWMCTERIVFARPLQGSVRNQFLTDHLAFRRRVFTTHIYAYWPDLDNKPV